MTPAERRALLTALGDLEAGRASPDLIVRLDRGWAEGAGLILGLTGPPGVGKSTLISALGAAWRGAGRTVAVIAVDPSSRVSGGALLGDRARIMKDPDDRGFLVRSLAARTRLGGLAEAAAGAAALLSAHFDRVILETVGVGQSETAIAAAADAVTLALQPASGDALQFLKAGIMEIPDVALVTKADLGDAARRSYRELQSALKAGGRAAMPAFLVSAETGDGVRDLAAAMEKAGARGRPAREPRGRMLVEDAVRARFGTAGVDLIGDVAEGARPFGAALAALQSLHLSRKKDA